MEKNDNNIFQDSFNNDEDLIIMNRKKCKYNKIPKPNKNRSVIMDNNCNDNKNYFRKQYMNDKIRNPKINRTLSDIYDTIKNINNINQKIYKIFYKRKNTKESNKSDTTSESINKISIKNQIINEYMRNKSNKQKEKKKLKRAHYSYDNIMKNNISSLLNQNEVEKKDNPNSRDSQNKIDDKSILYISSFISEELKKNRINNKLNYDYNDIHLRDKLIRYKSKLKRNQTSENIFDLNYFQDSKNIKDIIILEKYKQKEFQKLESIKSLKRKYFNNIQKEKNDSKFIINNNNSTKNKPFCFNDDIGIIKKNQQYNNAANNKTYNTNYYINKVFSINKENQNNRNYNQDIYNKNNKTSINNKLNFNYEKYKNILHN